MLSISVIIPTLNSSLILEKCLASLRKQSYPKSKVEIIIADGGSTDSTLKIAKKYRCRVVKNPLITAEAGKAVGSRYAKGDLIALIDSDNILPSQHWMADMVKPFSDPDIILTEPIRYTYRKKDPFLTRYFALLGMNDPLCLFTGNYDRFSYISSRWTDLHFVEHKRKGYLEVILDQLPLPTIGANGTIIKKKILENVIKKDKYLFDIDILIKIIKKQGSVKIAKVQTGIIHTFVEDNPIKFFKKQLRRINDMSFHKKQKNRELNWEKTFIFGILKFVIACILILPILYQMIVGFLRKPDMAWLFHPIACYSTLFIYIYGWIRGKIAPSESSRHNWKQ